MEGDREGSYKFAYLLLEIVTESASATRDVLEGAVAGPGLRGNLHVLSHRALSSGSTHLSQKVHHAANATPHWTTQCVGSCSYADDPCTVGRR